MEAVASLRTNVRQERNNYRSAHQALAAEQEKALKQHVEALRREVAEASLATSKFLNEMDAQQQIMTANQRQELDKQMLSLRSQVNQLRQAATTFLGDLDKSNQSMADELNLRLTGQRSRLATDTDIFINTISSAHREMATRQAQELREHAAKLHHNVMDLRTNASAFLKVTNATHRSMATEQKRRMVKGRSHLMTEVTARRVKNQVEQGVVRADLAEAAKIWANISQLKQKNRIKKDPAKSSRAAESAWGLDSPAEPSGPDDFTVIHGIGRGMAKLLYTAGISSFAHLAASTPEQLRQVLGKTGKLAKVESWIAQAQDLIR
jgi:predicted flap endonuclease-1-like 5' DNA nuclease